MNYFTTDKTLLDDGELYQIILKNGDVVKEVSYQKENTGQDGNPALFCEKEEGPFSLNYNATEDVIAWRLHPYHKEKENIKKSIDFAMENFIDDDSLLGHDMLKAIISKCNDLIKRDY